MSSTPQGNFKILVMASILEFCPEGSLKFSWSASGPTSATHTVQEATGCQECTIGLVLYELTGKHITPGYLLKALSQLKTRTDSNSWHYQMLDRFVEVAKNQKKARNASASDTHSYISTGLVLERPITDVTGFCIVDCDQVQQMHMNIECVTAFGAGAACRAPFTLEQRIGCFKKAIEGNLTGMRNPDDSLVDGISYDDLLAQWQTCCRRLRGVLLKDVKLPSQETSDASCPINRTDILPCFPINNIDVLRRGIHVQSEPPKIDSPATNVINLRHRLMMSEIVVDKLQKELLSVQTQAKKKEIV